MSKRGGSAPRPGKVAIKQARAGNYNHAVKIIMRAMASPTTPPKLAAKSRNIIKSDIGAKAYRIAKRKSR